MASTGRRLVWFRATGVDRMQATEQELLIVEDDPRLAERLAAGLSEAGFPVQIADSAASARRCLGGVVPALVLLDLGLPDEDGLTLLNELRAEHADLPVIITTARESIADRVRGLEGGADDYLVKPYAFEELLARIRTQLRHSSRSQLRREVGGLALDLQTRAAVLGGEPLDLTPREFDLLAFLASLNGEVASRDMIQREVWQVQSRMTSMDNVIDVHVSRLRKKLGEGTGAPRLLVVRGVGIALRAPA